MNHPQTWVVVANSCEAKLFTISKFPHIELVEKMEHPESKLHDQDLISSKPGRNFQIGGTTRHAYSPETDPKKQEIELFAKQLADRITSSHQKNAFQRLYLIASPAVLGMLRSHFNRQVQESIVKEISKDMINHTDQEIEKQLSL
jgi:protein required for attachment to host cells